jgi:transcriptional regulator with XRE-family HTH domain
MSAKARSIATEAAFAGLAPRLAQNVRQLREARGSSQVQMSKLAGVPRATWAHLESGEGNPTLAVLARVALALQVSLEELVAAPKASYAHYPKAVLPEKLRGIAKVRKLLPDAIPGMEIDRIEIPAGARFVGIPHTPGTREYLTCEAGSLELTVSGETVRVDRGDVVVFRGDQRHSYTNPGTSPAIGYSVVLLAKTA